MTRILDTTALQHLYSRGLNVREEHGCYVPVEIEEEFRGDSKSDAWFKANGFIKIPIDEVNYLASYACFLNQYSGVNFYSLKGFGDVAILAVLDLIVKAAPATLSLSEELFPQHSIRLVTNDRTLTNFVRRTFQGRVFVEKEEVFAKIL